MASADSAEELPTVSSGKRPINDLTASSTDEHVSPSQKRSVFLSFRLNLFKMTAII